MYNIINPKLLPYRVPHTCSTLHFICTHICTHTNKTQIINFSISSQFRLPNSSSTTAGQCIYDLFFRERKNGELNLPGLMSVFLFYLRIITKKFSLNLNWLLYILSILKTSLFIGFYWINSEFFRGFFSENLVKSLI